MLQELFRIPLINRPVYGFGLMMILGFFAATEFGKFLCRRSKIHPDILMNAALIALISGVLGARLSHVIENWSIYTDPKRGFAANFFDAINISSGGLTFYGGLLLATPITIAYGIKKKVPILLGMDIIAPCLMIGLGFGRIGCFLNGCCYGAECHSSWAVSFPYHSPAYLDEARENDYANVPPPLVLRIGSNRAEVLSKQELQSIQRLHQQLQTQPKGEVRAQLAHNGAVPANDAYLDALVDHAEKYGGQDLLALSAAQRSSALHPAQLYSAFNAFLIAALLGFYFTLPHIAGRGFALMLMVEGFTRYLLELLRVEPAVVWIGKYGMSLSMVLGLALVAAGAIMWITLGYLYPRSDESSPSLIPTPA